MSECGTKSRTIVMLGGSPLQVPAIQAARELGFHVICADWNPNSEGFLYADEHSVTSTLDVDAVERLARESCAEYVITSTSDAPVRVAALVSERLGLPTGISYENAICATQKDAMRKRLAEYGVPIPQFAICASEEEAVSACRSFGCDCVVKPADSSASRGVTLVDFELSDSAVRAAYREASSYSRKGTVMVEERVRGHEVSVECMTIGGATQVLAITDKLVTEPPYFVELGHNEPSMLSSEAQKAIADTARQTIAAVGIVDGPSHTEIMMTEDGPKVIEMAARLGGDYITSKLVPLSTGIDMVQGSVSVALGHSYDFTPTLNRGAAIRFITSGRDGVIRSIGGMEQAKLLPGVVDVKSYLNVGDTICAPHSSGDRIGHIVAVGADAKQAVRIAESALKSIYVKVW